MKFGTDGHGGQIMNPDDFGDLEKSEAFPLKPVDICGPDNSCEMPQKLLGGLAKFGRGTYNRPE